MRRSFSAILCFASLAVVGTAHAQVNTNPAGGLTVQTVQIEDGGWAFVEFEETVTEIENNCEAANTLFGTFPKVLWVDPAETGAKQVIATLLALTLADKKASGITLYNLGSYCTLYAIRVQPE